MPKGKGAQGAGIAGAIGTDIEHLTKTEVTMTEEKSVNYIKRSISIHLELDATINELVKIAKTKGERVSRSSIIDTALRAYLKK